MTGTHRNPEGTFRDFGQPLDQTITSVPDGEQVARHVVGGSATQIADAFAAYRELGVGDVLPALRR
jgi:hypothetical protein